MCQGALFGGGVSRTPSRPQTSSHKNARPGRIHKQKACTLCVAHRPLISRTLKTSSWTALTPWGHCEGRTCPSQTSPAAAWAPGAASERPSTVNPQPQLPVGKVRSFNISEYETLKPYLISLVDLGIILFLWVRDHVKSTHQPTETAPSLTLFCPSRVPLVTNTLVTLSYFPIRL